ncbi:MAG: nucleoside-diphosphate kinase [Myxococcales bacterium]|nr:nucleoside-diphosphate kinase [Myxococcales bacterium]
MIETTLILLKPDCVSKSLAGETIKRFEAANLQIVGCKMQQLSSEKLREHYAHIADKPFYPEVEGFMQSAPVIAMALRGENAIAAVRELVGPTDSSIAPAGSIRGDLGEDKMRNIVHASDSSEAAQAELKRFFNAGEVLV